MWIKHFSAPNVRYIGEMAFGICGIESVYFPFVVEVGNYAFAYCNYITYIKDEDFPSLEGIGHGAFRFCTGLFSIKFPKANYVGGQAFSECISLAEIYFPELRVIASDGFYETNLISIDLPKVTKIYAFAFHCNSLLFVSMGTGFEEETEIDFDYKNFNAGVFRPEITPSVELVLGSLVLPKPDLIENTWNYHSYGEKSFIWKNITIHDDIKYEEENLVNIYYIDKDIYYIDADIDDLKLELYDIAGRRIKKISNEKTIDISDLQTGFYLLNLINNKNQKTIKTEKLIKH